MESLKRQLTSLEVKMNRLEAGENDGTSSKQKSYANVVK